MNKHNKSRSSFSGKIGYVLAAAGASVGLGNIWRFPYLAAKYGGDTIELICLGGCPQRKQSRQRVAAQNDFDVFREIKLLFQ